MNTMMFPFAGAFPLVRYHLHGIVERRVAFNDFAGSALRGAFGHALKAAACATLMPACADCPLYRTCAYTAIFEPPPPAGSKQRQTTVPWVVEPPAPGPFVRERGQPFGFGLVLIGPALDHLALILTAWRSALSKDIGNRGQVRLTHVTDAEGHPVLDFTTGGIQPHGQSLPIPTPPAYLENADLCFHTPLSMTRDGLPLPPEHMRARDVLMAVVRRVESVMRWQLDLRLDMDFFALELRARHIQGHAQWQPLYWQRWSGRQRRGMPMGGVIHGQLASAG